MNKYINNYLFTLMTNALIVFSQIIIQLCKVYSQKLLSTNIKIWMDSAYIYLSIGQPQANMFELINQDFQYSWATSRFFVINASTSSKYLGETTVDYHNRSFMASDFEDIITFDDPMVTSTFRFKIVFNIDDLLIDAGDIAFPHKFIDEQYSLIHRLKADGKIDHLAYSIIFTEGIDRQFNLGGIPSSLIETKQSGSCNVLIDNDKWGCDLRQVYFTNDNKTDDIIGASFNSGNCYNNLNEAYFQVKEQMINAPSDFIDYMISKIFKAYLDKKYCEYSIKTHDNQLDYIICNNTILHALPLITFVFETMSVSLALKKLFQDNKGVSKLLINHSNEYGDKWVFGHSFLSIFYSLFDYDNHLITLYADKGILKINEHSVNNVEVKLNDKARWWCYLIVLCLMLFGLFFLIIIKGLHFKKTIGDYKIIQ